MRLNIRTFCIICLLGGALGCSSNNSSSTSGDGVETPGNGGETPGNGGETPTADSSLTAIATAASNSEPTTLDIAALQASLNGLPGAEPVPVEPGDTVSSLLEKAR